MSVVLAVLIPVYNEERLIERAVARFDACPPPLTPEGELTRKLYLVDDGSTDLTAAAMETLKGRPDVVCIRHDRNRGKGAALRTALGAAVLDGADLFIVHDADLEYDPADHAAMLGPLLDGRADAVIGSRFLGSAHRVLYYWHSVANRFITAASNMLTNLNLSDIECCLKAFTRPVAERLTIQEDRFGVEPELVSKLAGMKLPEIVVPRAGIGTAVRSEAQTAASPTATAVKLRRLRVYEVAVSYAGRTYAEGKKITWEDGFWALWCIVKYNLMT